jgi:hypothetical protein
MTLGDDIAAALPGLRRQAESRMRSRCRVVRSVGAPVKDESGELRAPTETIYEGPCRLRTVSTVTSAIEAASQLLVGQAAILSFPVATSTGIRVNDIVTFVPVDGDDLDPALLEQTARIAGLHFDTNATARRLPIEMIS